MSCGLLALDVQHGPRARRYGKQHSCNKGSMFVGMEEQGNHDQISGEMDYSLRSTKPVSECNRPSVSKRLLEAPDYSGHLIPPNHEQMRFLPEYSSDGSGKSSLDMDSEVGSIKQKDGPFDGHISTEMPCQGDCFGLSRRNYIVSATGSEVSTGESEMQGTAVAVSSQPQIKALNNLKQGRPVGPSRSDVVKTFSTVNTVPTSKEKDEMSTISAAAGSCYPHQCSDSTRSNKNGRNNVADVGKSYNVDLEKNLSVPIEGQGSMAGCSSCFGRVITSTRSSGEGSTVCNDGSSSLASEGLQWRKSSASGYAFGKGLNRRSLRHFGCMSSRDVLPCVTDHIPNGGRNHAYNKHKSGPHDTKQKTAARNSKSSVLGSAGCMVRRNFQCGLGCLMSEQGTVKEELSPVRSVRASAPAHKASKWCFKRPTSVKSDTKVSNAPMSCASSSSESSILMPFGEGKEGSRMSTECCENTPGATVVDGEVSSQSSIENSYRGSNLVALESGALELDRRISTRSWVDSGLSSTMASFRHDELNASSSIFSGTPPTSTPAPLPSLPRRPHHPQSFEAASFPSSYRSSPDVQFSSSDMIPTYASNFESPNSSTADSSPKYREGHYRQSAETPVYRSLRQFPRRSFEERQLYFSFEGLSEILSARDHVDKDEISYELFMVEANSLFSGIASHDQHRDMRLDVDNMSYEELLALEERIGNVCTGLEKDVISRCLKSKKYSFTDTAANCIRQESEIKCSICQEEFEESVELGILECGHNHHFQCIEQWLLQKNQCPICKASASS